jgi:hypothetical protein
MRGLLLALMSVDFTGLATGAARARFTKTTAKTKTAKTV